MLVQTQPATKGVAPAYLRLYESGELTERVNWALSLPIISFRLNSLT